MHDPDPHNERALLLSVARDDERAYSMIFHRYRDKIYSIAFKLTDSVQTSEEIVQDVFLKVWLKRATLHEIERFDAWLFIVARNMIYSWLRKSAPPPMIQTEEADGWLPISKDLASNGIEEKELQQLLQKAVNRLSQQQKQVYQLFAEQGLKYDRIAQLMQIAPETVRKHLQCATRNIRAYILSNIEMSLLLIFYTLL